MHSFSLLQFVESNTIVYNIHVCARLTQLLLRCLFVVELLERNQISKGRWSQSPEGRLNGIKINDVPQTYNTNTRQEHS